jgi:hypothetical protein
MCIVRFKQCSSCNKIVETVLGTCMHMGPNCQRVKMQGLEVCQNMTRMPVEVVCSYRNPISVVCGKCSFHEIRRRIGAE